MSTVTADPSSKPRLSPRKRAQRMRWAQYAVLGIVTILAISMANWSQIQSVFFRGDMIHETLTQGLPNAFKNTIVYTLGAFVFGLVLGTMLALMRLSSGRALPLDGHDLHRVLPRPARHHRLHRLRPAAAGLPGVVIPVRPVRHRLDRAGTRVLRHTWPRPFAPASRPCPRARSRRRARSGCRPAPATRKIVLPQAFRIITPPLTNELILLVKDSSLVYMLGLSDGFELTKYGRDLANTNANLTPLVVAASATCSSPCR
jgi:polar amino acid transport system permease protein